MKGLHFSQTRLVLPESPVRVDIACFIGFVRFREVSVPENITGFLADRGWLNHSDHMNSPYFRPSALSLRDVPVPIESWDTFNYLFAWEERSIDGNLLAATYLGAAVRAFFMQGGRKCYVISAGDPFIYNAPLEQRIARVSDLLPGYPLDINANKHDRQSWHGVGHLLGLPDVSFVALPDLVDLFKAEAIAINTDTDTGIVSHFPEQFVECSSEPEPSEQDTALHSITAPRYGDENFVLWRNAIKQLIDFIARETREVQFVASLPIADEQSLASRDLLTFLYRQSWLSKTAVESPENIASAFLQLSYPWVKTPFSRQLPETLEPGDGCLIGMLAKNTLVRGTFRSAVKIPQRFIYDVFPKMTLAQISLLKTGLGDDNVSDRLEDRLSLWHPNVSGIGLRSDVTTSHSSRYSNGSVNRTLMLILRTARLLGEEFMFESNGENLWQTLENRMSTALNALYQLGALDGKSSDEAFSVRCGRLTMTQQDIDNGRVIAEISVNIAASIETLLVSFSVQGSSDNAFSRIGLLEAAS